MVFHSEVEIWYFDGECGGHRPSIRARVVIHEELLVILAVYHEIDETALSVVTLWQWLLLDNRWSDKRCHLWSVVGLWCFGDCLEGSSRVEHPSWLPDLCCRVLDGTKPMHNRLTLTRKVVKS